ncbi:sensor histidine kinase [Hydrogenophaga aquatica]
MGASEVDAMSRVRTLEAELLQARASLAAAVKDAEHRVRRSHDLLRALVLRQQSERENERRTLAHGIHEDLAQNLTVLRMGLALLGQQPDADSHARQLEGMRQIVDRSLERLREMVAMIRPAALDMGVGVALRWLVDDFQKGVQLPIDLYLPEQELSLDEPVTTCLFRSTQEALLNAVMHAHATRVVVRLTVQAGMCELVVADNGHGFDLDALRPEGAFGLIHINEQARHLGGQVRISTCPGQGTKLRLQVPATLCMQSQSGADGLVRA